MCKAGGTNCLSGFSKSETGSKTKFMGITKLHELRLMINPLLICDGFVFVLHMSCM